MSLFRSVILALTHILILLISSPLAAQEATIHEVIAMALAHNHTIIAANAEITAAQATTEAAKGGRLPKLNVSSGVQRSDAPLDAFGSLLQQRSITAADFAPNRLNNPGNITNYHSQASLVLPLYHGGALSAAIDEGDARTHAQQAQQQSTTQAVIAAAIGAFIAAKSSSAEITARKQEIAAARQRLHDIQLLQQQGMALDSDTMDAKAHLLQSKLALIHSKNARDNSIDRLRQITTDNTLTIGGDITLQPITSTLESWTAEAILQRPDLQALLSTRQALTHRRSAQRARWLPSVDLIASQQWNSGNLGLRNRNSTIGATVSINLFNGGSDQARVSAVEAKLAAMDATIAQKKATIRQQVQVQWRAWQEAQLQLENSRQLRQQRQEALRIRKLRHQQGLETSSELLRTQVANDVAQVATIRARYGVLQAITLLYMSAGALTLEVVQ